MRISDWSSDVCSSDLNGPMRSSLYDDPDYKALVPYAEFERRALTVARPTLPSFDNAARAADVIQEEAEAAILGYKRSEESRVVKECGSTCRYRWSPYH